MTEESANAVETADQDTLIAQEDANANSSALLRILSNAGARRILAVDAADSGLAENRPYPFMALVGQIEMRIALLLAVVNPAIGGVLLIGTRGTGKTTAVRSLIDVLPDVEVSDSEDGGMLADMAHPDARLLFPDSWMRHEAEESVSHYEATKLVELPLNARLEDVVGGVNERIAVQQSRIRLERGILARADQHLLYIDEVNLLSNDIIDAILDASAQGHYTVRRGAMSGTYRSRFVLIGSMNPEEGKLRPQILDRFGLRVNVRGLVDKTERLEVYQRVREYRQNPMRFIREWEWVTAQTRDELMTARELLKTTVLAGDAIDLGLSLVGALDIDSHRAEYTLFEAARAYAAADGRTTAIVEDIHAVAPMALRQRRSDYMIQFFIEQRDEDEQIRRIIDQRDTPNA